jgi:hypothetical protein
MSDLALPSHAEELQVTAGSGAGLWLRTADGETLLLRLGSRADPWPQSLPPWPG